MIRNRLSAIALLYLCGCASAEPTLGTAGWLENPDVREASGLATSTRHDEVLWVINDSGSKPVIHAIATDGSRRGEVHLLDAGNIDWEDLAAFRSDGESLLMVADIGDNLAVWRHRSLYVVTEPDVESDGTATASRRVDFRYPDGPRDAESAAVDAGSRSALVLTKRDLPPRLYSIPLEGNADSVVQADFLGTIDSLKEPTEHETRIAPDIDDWYWQPVGMDISADGESAVILTYEAVYYFRRTAGQSWLEALNSRPLRVPLEGLPNAEAVAFGQDRWTVFVTGENRHSPLVRIDFPRNEE